MEKYYTVDQIASLLSIHPKTIQRYIREGKLRANKIGKSWRVTGHDLSIFAETTGMESLDSSKRPQNKVMVSSVVEIQVDNFDESIRIINGLTAALNAKPQEYGRSAMHAQHLEYEGKVRVSLWGTVEFIKEMMDLISVITD